MRILREQNNALLFPKPRKIQFGEQNKVFLFTDDYKKEYT